MANLTVRCPPCGMPGVIGSAAHSSRFPATQAYYFSLPRRSSPQCRAGSPFSSSRPSPRVSSSASLAYYSSSARSSNTSFSNPPNIRPRHITNRLTTTRLCGNETFRRAKHSQNTIPTHTSPQNGLTYFWSRSVSSLGPFLMTCSIWSRFQIVDIYRSKLRDDATGIEGDEIARKRIESYANSVRPVGFVVRRGRLTALTLLTRLLRII